MTFTSSTETLLKGCHKLYCNQFDVFRDKVYCPSCQAKIDQKFESETAFKDNFLKIYHMKMRTGEEYSEWCEFVEDLSRSLDLLKPHISKEVTQ